MAEKSRSLVFCQQCHVWSGCRKVREKWIGEKNEKIVFWAESENCEEKAVAERLTAGTSGQDPLL